MNINHAGILNTVPSGSPSPLVMPTITGYTPSGSETILTGISSYDLPTVSSVALTPEKIISVGARSNRSDSSIYVNGMDWSGASPVVTNFNLAYTNGFRRIGKNGGITLVRLTDDKALGIYQNETTSVNWNFFSYSGGTSPVTVINAFTTSGNGGGGYSSGIGICFHSDGDQHYIALASCNPNDGNYDSYINFYKADSTLHTVTFLTKGRIHIGADNSAEVQTYGIVEPNTYGFLGVCNRNTGWNGAIGYATMKFNVNTETLTVSSNENVADTLSYQPNFLVKYLVNIAPNKIVFVRRTADGTQTNKQFCISYDGTTTTIENVSILTTYLYQSGGLKNYKIDGYSTPTNQLIFGFENISDTNRALLVNTLTFDDATNVLTEQAHTTQIEATLDTNFNNLGGAEVFFKDPNNAVYIFSDRFDAAIKYTTFTINTI